MYSRYYTVGVHFCTFLVSDSHSIQFTGYYSPQDVRTQNAYLLMKSLLLEIQYINVFDAHAN
jgi:hypothetical protein